MEQASSIRGWGADAALESRPGVPEETDPPRPFGNMSLGFPSRQAIGPPTVTSPLRPLTPVFGTAVPPRGLSGALRQLAYQSPDYKPQRWLLLRIADRLDVIEHGVFPRFLALSLALGALAGAGWVGRGMVRSLRIVPRVKRLRRLVAA